jgi:hypothetical protein
MSGLTSAPENAAHVSPKQPIAASFTVVDSTGNTKYSFHTLLFCICETSWTLNI